MTRKIIGSLLIAIPLLPLYGAAWLFMDTKERFDIARDAVLLSSTELKTNESKEFSVTYPHAHGVWVMNAVETDDANEAQLLVKDTDGGEPLNLVYEDVEKSLIYHYDNPIVVTKTREFGGAIHFKHVVCGCETTGPFIYLFIVAGLTFAFVLAGIWIMRRKPKPSA